MSDAIAKALPTCIYRTPGRVGFARGGKLLLKITNVDNMSLPSEPNLAFRLAAVHDHRLGNSVPVLLCRFLGLH